MLQARNKAVELIELIEHHSWARQYPILEDLWKLIFESKRLNLIIKEKYKWTGWMPWNKNKIYRILSKNTIRQQRRLDTYKVTRKLLTGQI